MPDIERVEPGSLWIDNDARNRATRFIRVEDVNSYAGDGSGAALVTSWYDEEGGPSRLVIRRIKLSRFRNNSSGYRPADYEPTYGRPA